MRVKMQFGLLVKYSIVRKKRTIHGALFHTKQVCQKYEAMINNVFNSFIDQDSER